MYLILLENIAPQMDTLHGCGLNQAAVIPQEAAGDPEPDRNRERNITEKYLNADKFGKTVIALVHGYVFDELITTDTDELRILDTFREMTNRMVTEKRAQMAKITETLQKSFRSSGYTDRPSVFYTLTFEEISKKVGEIQSWNSLASMFICVNITKRAAGNNFDVDLKKSMELVLISYLTDHYKLFVNQSGGWESVIEYNKYVKSTRNTQPITFWAFVILCGLLLLGK